jgi:hypothetical protein
MPGEGTLRKRVSALLVERGFKRRGRMHLRRVDSDLSLWVDTGPLGRQEDVSPFIGVRSDRVEDAFGRWLGVPPDKHVGTFGANVGYVIDGSYRNFKPPATEFDVVAVIEQGLSRYQLFLSFDRLPEAEAVAGIKDPGRAYRLVVVHALRGDLAAARQALVEAEREYCRYPGEVCEQFRAFVQRARVDCQGL